MTGAKWQHILCVSFQAFRPHVYVEQEHALSRYERTTTQARLPSGLSWVQLPGGTNCQQRSKKSMCNGNGNAMCVLLCASDQISCMSCVLGLE